MDISYRNVREEYLYNDKKALLRKYGVKQADKILQRLGELNAAANPNEMPKNARFHGHEGNRKGLFSVDLVHPFRLIVRPTCKYLNPNEITAIEIYEVMDPH